MYVLVAVGCILMIIKSAYQGEGMIPEHKKGSCHIRPNEFAETEQGQVKLCQYMRGQGLLKRSCVCRGDYSSTMERWEGYRPRDITLFWDSFSL